MSLLLLINFVVSKNVKSRELTKFLHHQLPRRWVVQASGKVVAVPDKQLGTSWDRLHSIEVNLHAILTRRQVLLCCRVGRVHIPHPVGASLIQAIDKVMKLSVHINLKRERKKKIIVS